jgi:hypothetical protein
VKLHLAVALVLSGCLTADVDDSVDTTVAEEKILGGTPVTGHRGVVSLSARFACTGFMLGARVIVTAAHCVTDGSTGSGSMQIPIHYYDPATGRRRIDSGEWLSYRVHPHYAGDGDEEDDVAVIVRNQRWIDTDEDDYLPVYMDRFARVDRVRVWGRGTGAWSEPATPTPTTLRNRNFGVHGFDYDVFWTEAGETRRLCRGDSGGPAILEVAGLELVTGVNSTVERWPWDQGSRCAREGGAQRHTRLNWEKLSWIIGATGISCPARESGGWKYHLCR